MKLILVLLTILSLCIGEQMFTLVKHSQQRGAACLDGSPPGFYYHQGKGANKNKFMMYFDSGGNCAGSTVSQTLQNCYKRSFSSLGTTTNYPSKKSFDNYGLLSPIQQKNPVFYDWTKIFVIYCDGSQYQGSRSLPIAYKDRNLYFRGYNNTVQQFRAMQQMFDFYNGQTIVMTGVSAGGIATYHWSNYLFQRTKKAQVLSIPDSGFFLVDYYSPIVNQKVLREHTKGFFQLVNSQIDPPTPQCLKDFDGDVLSCFNAVNLAKYLKAPFFHVISPYDQWSMNNLLIVQCLKNKDVPYSLQNCNETTMNAIKDYRKQVLNSFEALKNKRKQVGFWSPACVQHGFSDQPSFSDNRYRVPGQNGKMLYEAIGQFVKDPFNAKSYIDSVQWPNNKGCNGLSNSTNEFKKRFIRKQ